MQGFVGRLQAELGGVHYLVNNAGIARDGALWRLTDTAWSEVMDTNVTGAFHCIQAVAQPFRTQPAADVPPPALPLPTAGIAGQPVAVYPLTLIASDKALGWQDDFRPRREALTRADSIIASGLTERSPEVTWVLPDVLRRGANQAPGLLAKPRSTRDRYAPRAKSGKTPRSSVEPDARAHGVRGRAMGTGAGQSHL